MHCEKALGIALITEAALGISAKLGLERFPQVTGGYLHWLLRDNLTHLSEWVSKWVETKGKAQGGVIVSEIICLGGISSRGDNRNFTIW